MEPIRFAVPDDVDRRFLSLLGKASKGDPAPPVWFWPESLDLSGGNDRAVLPSRLREVAPV